MEVESVDAIVVGLGVGGQAAAGRLLEGGLSVLGVEEDLIGGECKNYGCVPTKMMVRAAGALADAERVESLGGSAHVRPDWTMVANRIRTEGTNDWHDIAAEKSFLDQGGRLVRGHAELVGEGRVRVDGTEYQATRGVLLATGTRPAVPPIEGLADTPYWTNRDAVRMTSVPRSVIVIGGGAVGVELAQVMARFAARVTLLEAAARLLGEAEPEVCDLARQALEADHVDVRTGTSALRVDHLRDAFRVALPGEDHVAAERLIVATGRRANVDNIGLGECSTVEVDPWLRAGPKLWAIGDITGKGQYTHVATYQARIAADDMLGRERPGADYRAVPRLVFCDPEIGTVGLTEQQAREQGLAVAVGQSVVAESARGWLHGAGNTGLVKLVVDTDRGVLVGASSVGPMGGEVLGMLTLAVRAGTPLATLHDTIYAYPTFHRAVEDALRTL